jgi:phage terminase large subunit
VSIHRLPWTPRAWQRPLLDDRAPRIVAVVHRRAGKSDAVLWRGLRKAATWTRSHIPAERRNLTNAPVRVVHVLPYSVQWERTGLWDRLEAAARAIPGAEIKRAEKRIVLPAGGVYQAGGMDRPETWRGGYADELIEDEADDVTGDSLDTVIEPMLADYLGVRLKVGTPKGNGRLKSAFDRAGTEPGWSRYLLTWRDTGVLTEEQIARLRTEMTEEEFAQELECSFDMPNSGTYFGKLMQAAEREGRIGEVMVDPRLPVVTAWDLGVDDATAIWFVQPLHGGFHVIDYLEASGEGADFYAKEIKARPYAYAEHLLPHDAEQRSWNDARTRADVLRSLGVSPVRVGRATPVADGINAARMILPRCRFDARRCAAGLKALWSYRRQWNDQAGTWRTQPLHDWSSHGADAFRLFAVEHRPPRDPMQPRPAARAEGSDYDPLNW